MKQRKIRGNNRRQKNIESWRVENLNLRLDILDYYHFDHVDIVVHPWCDISTVNSKIPEPKGDTKILMLNGLIDIYHSWKKQLEGLGNPYYLKIWLFEPRFSRSQVVCALGDMINFYENSFYQPEIQKDFIHGNYGVLQNKLSWFAWDYRLDEDYYDNSEVGKPESYASIQEYESESMRFNKLLTKPHRQVVFNEPIGDITESYYFKRGNLWIGGK